MWNILKEKALSEPNLSQLSRRERQIMDQLFRLKEGSVADIRNSIDNPSSYSSLRALMGILVEKGFLTRRHEGNKYIYRPIHSRDHAGNNAMKHMLEIFFDDSIESAVAALMNVSKSKLSKDELSRLAEMIEKARKEGR